MQTPEISVIIPVYNVAKYLPECLNSLKRQTFMDFEAVCVNDGSSDGSLDILKEYAASDGRFRIIDKENEGSALSRKKGISEARGNIIYFLDADDALEENALDESVESMNECHSEMAYVKYCEYDGNIRKPYPDSDLSSCFPKGTDFSSFSFKGADSGEALLNKACCAMWSSAVKADLFRRYNDWFFPEKNLTLIEDVPLHCQLNLRAESISFCNKSLYLYRNSREGSTLSSLGKSDRAEGIFVTVSEVKRIMMEAGVFERLFSDFVLFAVSHIKVIYASLEESFRESYFQKMRSAFKELQINGSLLKKLRYDNYVFCLAVLKSDSHEELESNIKGFKYYMLKSFYKLLQAV
ncbi:MAG: glycosyltransferase [bacterium]|nr:glycosyltransferase [bacterium]